MNISNQLKEVDVKKIFLVLLCTIVSLWGAEVDEIRAEVVILPEGDASAMRSVVEVIVGHYAERMGELKAQEVKERIPLEARRAETKIRMQSGKDRVVIVPFDQIQKAIRDDFSLRVREEIGLNRSGALLDVSVEDNIIKMGPVVGEKIALDFSSARAIELAKVLRLLGTSSAVRVAEDLEKKAKWLAPIEEFRAAEIQKASNFQEKLEDYQLKYEFVKAVLRSYSATVALSEVLGKKKPEHEVETLADLEKMEVYLLLNKGGETVHRAVIGDLPLVTRLISAEMIEANLPGNRKASEFATKLRGEKPKKKFTLPSFDTTVQF